MNSKSIPLLTLFSILLLVTATTVSMNVAVVNASDNDDQQQQGATIPGQLGQGQGIAVGEPDPNNGNDEEEEDPIPTEPGGGPGGGTGGGVPTGRNTADANQVGGISAGDIIQRSNAQVTEQYCNTVAGIGDRRCQQEAPEGALQECRALAGLGAANCVQSENPDGTGTCLSANGRPYICQTDTGVSISGSGQAGQ